MVKKSKEQALRLVREKLSATMAERTAWYEKTCALLRQHDNIYLWGTGVLGVWVPAFLHAIGGTPKAFVDNNPARWGADIHGIPCISPAEIPLDKDPLVMIGTGAHSHAVSAQLHDMGVERVLDVSDFILNEMFDDIRCASVDAIADKVGACFDILADDTSAAVLLAKLSGFLTFEAGFGKQNYYEDVCCGDQYFQDDLIHFTENSVLVDCGAFTGDTLADFLRRGLPFRKYIAYELSRRNYDTLQENIKNVHEGGTKIVAYNCGVGERNEQIFYEELFSGTLISSAGTRGEIVRMSEHLRDEAVSFIKMDIEGAEIAALKGAAELIRRRRPDLAICTYHSISDLYEVPLYIHSLVPEYRLYLRHHTPVHYETVCYAVV